MILLTRTLVFGKIKVITERKNMSFIDEAKPQFEKVREHLLRELAMVRTGRANPALVEDLQVEMYGAMQPVKALASIGTPDSRTLQIEPWDTSATKAIEVAIQKSNIGINPNVDGKIIRLNMPMMTDEIRQRMVKVIKEKLEEGKIATRKVREEVKKKVQKQDEVGDDDKRAELDDLEKRVKEVVADLEAICAKKEKEVTSI